MTALYEELTKSIKEEKIAALATIISGPGLGSKLLVWPGGRVMGSLAPESLRAGVIKYANDQMAKQESGSSVFDVAGENVEVFVDVYPPLPKLLIIGAVHIAIPLVKFAKILGFHTIVIDARSMFATKERFPDADELILKWPSEALIETGINQSTYIVTLTHDKKFDNPVLKAAVESPARYIGALGSKKTHAARIKDLREMGITESQLSRIHAPIGLDLGARTAEEIAISIVAEIVASRYGRR